MRLLLTVFLGFATARALAADPTALAALKLLSPEQAARIARIEAREGTPAPERWYLTVWDPKADNGVREFVVANNEIVATRNVSQFAESLKAADVIGNDGLKIDSDALAKLARQYAQANDANVVKINYRLKRTSADASPVWQISCLDSKDAPVGELIVTAGKGNVLSHNGFANAPQTASEKKKKPAKFDSYAESQVKPVATPLPPDPAEMQPAAAQPEERPARRPRRIWPF